MITYQTRIFVPYTPPYDTGETWAETALGRIIRPLVMDGPEFSWFWFSRYANTRGNDVNDCEMAEVPDTFFANDFHKSLRFRFQVDEDRLEQVQIIGDNLIREAGCFVSDWRPYDVVEDLGSNRLLGEKRDREHREQRSQLVAQFYYSTARLVLDTLIGPDAVGRFRQEYNDQNRYHSSFEVLHHVYCNITSVPTGVDLPDISGRTIHYMVNF